MLRLTFCFEVKVVCQVTALVVPAQHEELVRAQQLATEQEHHRFEAETAAIGVVAKEQVGHLLRRTRNFEQLHEVVELAVNVSTHYN